MTDNSLIELTEACYNKVESELLEDKYLNSSPLKTMLNLLEGNGFSSLHDFTQFLIHKYQSDLNVNEIFIYQNLNYKWVVLPEQRQTLLSFFKSVIRDLQLKQLGIPK